MRRLVVRADRPDGEVFYRQVVLPEVAAAAAGGWVHMAVFEMLRTWPVLGEAGTVWRGSCYGVATGLEDRL